MKIHDNCWLVNPDLKKFDEYMIIKAAPAVGIVYIINNFVSAHARLRVGKNGAYPYKYLEMIDSIFGELPASDVIEVCSGSVHEGAFTVDIDPQSSPLLIGDGEILEHIDDNVFTRWRCDPPYNAEAAKRMYKSRLPDTMKLLKAGMRVVREGGLLFLLSSQNYQWKPKGLKRIGCILLTIVPNNEIRACNIYLKLQVEKDPNQETLD
jgi:hypothetical protein